MRTSNPKQRLDWRRIALAAAAISIAAFSAVAIPLIRQEWAAREERRLEAMYATGLSPCGRYRPSDIDALLKQYLPGTPTASITVSPSFSPTVAIRLIGEDLYYFVLEFPIYEMGGKPPPTLNTKGVPAVHHSRVSSEIARQLPLILANDIKHAQAELPLGLDGTTYYFQTSQESCAKAWSPDTDTRAGQFVALFEQLEKRAQPNGISAVGDHEILKSLKLLQPD